MLTKVTTAVVAIQVPLGVGLTFAQAVSGDAFGASGWASFGIAGLVLSWLLLKHLPSKDAQLERLITLGDERALAILDKTEKRTKDIADQSVVREKEQRQDFKEALQSIIKQSEVSTSSIQKTVTDEVTRLRDVMFGLSSTVSEMSGKVHILDIQKENKE